jgi:hypothetical protein
MTTHPTFFCDVDDCEGCDARILVDDTPGMEDEPHLAMLQLPTLAGMQMALQIVDRAKRRGGDLSAHEELVAMLFDTVVAQRELLIRAVMHGVDGVSRNKEEDDVGLREALLVARDLFRVGLILDDAPTDVPRALQIDVGNVFYELQEADAEAQHAKEEEEECDNADCPLHGPNPVPTNYEA